jgi:hypothetical protein
MTFPDMNAHQTSVRRRDDGAAGDTDAPSTGCRTNRHAGSRRSGGPTPREKRLISVVPPTKPLLLATTSSRLGRRHPNRSRKRRTWDFGATKRPFRLIEQVSYRPLSTVSICLGEAPNGTRGKNRGRLPLWHGRERGTTAVAEGAVVGGSATGSGGSATVAGTEPDVPGVTKGAEPAGAERSGRSDSPRSPGTTCSGC